MVDVAVVQGKGATDIEARVAISLTKFGWDFQFQEGVMGGRSLRGGQVVDFMVQTLPLPTPLYVNGEYFHGSAVAERDKLLRDMLYSYMHGQINPPVVVWGDQLQTQEESDKTILNLFGRNR